MKIKDYFNIPNILGYIRILLLPVFLVLYYSADTTNEFITAFVVLAVSIMTDFFDGKIARKFNMVTEFGKVLDPIADKLTQIVLVAAIIPNHRFIVALLIIAILKEIYMGLMGLYIIKVSGEVNSAKWYGKLSTAFLDILIFLFFVFPGISENAANILITIMICFAIFALVMYIRFHLGILQII